MSPIESTMAWQFHPTHWPARTSLLVADWQIRVQRPINRQRWMGFD